MNMILVKNIEVVVMLQDIIPITQMNNANLYKFTDQVEKEMKILVEQVSGKKFINARGQEFCIGMTKQVQEAIGLPFKVYDNLQKEVNALRKINERIESELNQVTYYANLFRIANFYKRIKYLFTSRM